MDFKSLISKLDSMEAPPTTPEAPTLPKSIQLDEDIAMHVLAGTRTLTEAADLMEKKLTKAEKDKKEEIVKSMKDDKAGFKKRYGEKGEEVMHATATKIAKKKTESTETLDSEDELDEVFDADAKPGDKKKTSSGVATKTATGLKHEKSYGKDSDDSEDDDAAKSKKKKKNEDIDTAAFKSKFLKMVEAAKKDDKKVKGKKAEEKMDEGSKPDFLDVDKDGDKKEPMKKAAKEADKGEKKDDKKGMSDKQAKYFGKKNESVKTSKKVVAESIELPLTFKDMVKLVQESGGQQQIDALDKELFAWANRVAQKKLGEGMKAEVYAGLIYERMGGKFEMYDVLAETKK